MVSACVGRAHDTYGRGQPLIGRIAAATLHLSKMINEEVDQSLGDKLAGKSGSTETDSGVICSGRRRDGVGGNSERRPV